MSDYCISKQRKLGTTYPKFRVPLIPQRKEKNHHMSKKKEIKICLNDSELALLKVMLQRQVILAEKNI